MHKDKDQQLPLNPVAHILIESVPEQEERELFVVQQQGQQRPGITVRVEHAPSPYVVRFTQEQSFSEDVATPSTNLLHAQDVAIQAEEEPTQDLHISVEELTPHVRSKRISVTAAAAAAPLRVNDQVGEDVLLDLDALIAHAETLETEDSTREEEPLLTFDDLIDDIAVQEELADIEKAPSLAPQPTVVRATTPKAPRRAKKPRLHRIPVGSMKTLAVFIALSFAVVLPIQAVTTINGVQDTQNTVIASGEQAASSISRGVSAVAAQDFTGASAEFDRAAQSFDQAQEALRTTNRDLVGIAELLPQTGRQLSAARNLLRSGEALAQAATTLSDGMQTVANRTDERVTAAVSLFDVFAENALPDLEQAAHDLNEINLSAVPAEHRSTVRQARKAVNGIAQSLATFHASADAINALLGHKQQQRYLILFQNNTELRATGGFWGSLAEVDILDGEIVRMDVPGGGTYDLQGSLTTNVAAPEPLQLLRARWELQDANWFPDFPTSAQKAMWFYEKSGGPTVDGVIAVNATVVSELIDATGPINDVDGENFLFEVRKEIEQEKTSGSNTPKAILGELAPVLLERLTDASGDQFLDVSDILGDSLSGRDIQIYHRDPDIQNAIEELGWDGALLPSTGDYLMVSHTNVGGGKTDGVIDDSIVIDSVMREDGRIENTVHVTRTHHGIASSSYSGTNNVTFTRLFVPRGSELLSVDGATPPDEDLFETTTHLSTDEDLGRLERSQAHASGATVTEGLGKTSFGHWMQTRPGTSSTLTFRYVLPADILDAPQQDLIRSIKQLVGIPNTVRHSILIQKQPGVEYRETAYQFFPNDALRPIWSNQDTVTQIELPDNTDGFLGMILERI